MHPLLMVLQDAAGRQRHSRGLPWAAPLDSPDRDLPARCMRLYAWRCVDPRGPKGWHGSSVSI